ncbi:MAG: ABC transporter permease [Candidatus Poribacteria bacterium]|nr:ABC transporter permease [Candidatus Poribacteria bacterium]
MNDLQPFQRQKLYDNRTIWIRFADGLGSHALNWTYGVGSATMLVWETLLLIFRRPLQFNLLVRQLLLIGVNSVPVVLFTGVFTGVVLATQGYHELKDLSAEGSIGGFVTTSVIKELGPMVTAFVLAGRIGASITAELGTMKVTEQIDALEIMATNPVKYLVVPRFLACAIMLPILTIFATVFGIAGGYFTAVSIFDMNGRFFMKQARNYLFIGSIIISLIKASAFGMAIASIGCYKGFTIPSAGGAEGVGKATTGSAVTSLMTILAMDALLNQLLYTVVGLK